MQTINDKRQHDLSPEARIVERNGRVDVMSRAHKLFCQSGISIQIMRELSKSRSGRRRLISLVYRAMKEHYIDSGRMESYAVARARNAGLRFHRVLRQEAEYIVQRGRYTGIEKSVQVKDTTDPRASLFCEKAQGPIGAITPLENLISGLKHNRKPKHIQKPQPKPLAVTENGFIYARDSEANKVRSILKK